ncbi:BTB/POZ domain-containing protein 17 isoform X2 [Bacillus rossius redtenbacheri]|uniref:BTB/POZ domain-containing protein 17 isoform X2 n=1 Tax=Bacillus rossius redtenbacheri TaxID=93214 RepID=UPI002FDCE193
MSRRLKTSGAHHRSRMSHDVEYNNSRMIMQKIARLHSERLMNDVSLVVGGVEYPAHRLILCASSQVFQDLAELCLSYMRAHVALAAVKGQLVGWLQYLSNCGHNAVAQECRQFIKQNLDLVAGADDFEHFEPDVFVSLLQESDLVVEDEMTLYQWAVKWLNGQHARLRAAGGGSATQDDAHMQQLVREVMSHIRFPMIPPRALADLILSPLTTNEFFLDRMKIGMMYHKGQMAEACRVTGEEGGRLMFTPRLYTAGQWGTPLTVENFHALPAYHSRTLVFSSHRALADCTDARSCEWVVDIYPKGVWFMKFYQIVWQGTVEVPECVLRTVRLSLTCNERPLGGEVRVRVAILVRGVADRVEHTARVVTRDHRFSGADTVLNLDGLLPYERLNPPCGPAGSRGPARSPYLVGRERDCLKLHVVIVPLDRYCAS